jgi:hypothetical protein
MGKKRRRVAEPVDEARAGKTSPLELGSSGAPIAADVDSHGPFLWPLHGAPPHRAGPLSLERAGAPRVLLRTAEYLVVEKPPDVAMDGTTQSVTMNTLAIRWLETTGGSGQLLETTGVRGGQVPADALPLRWCHRLDHGTSGVLVLGLTKRAAAEAGQAFAERTTRKTYSALCAGHVDPAAFPWVDDDDEAGAAAAAGGETSAPGAAWSDSGVGGPVARSACVARVGELWAFRRRVGDAKGGATFLVDAPLCPMAPPDFRMQVAKRSRCMSNSIIRELLQ